MQPLLVLPQQLSNLTGASPAHFHTVCWGR